MCLQTFIAISQKLGPLGVSKIRAAKKDKLVDVPPKPEVLSLSHIYRWIELGARNFSPRNRSAPALPVFAQKLKNSRFRGNF